MRSMFKFWYGDLTQCLIVVIFALIFAPFTAHGQSYVQELDWQHSSIDFELNSTSTKSTGSITNFRGKLLLYPNSLENSQVDIIVDLGSLTSSSQHPYELLFFQAITSSLPSNQLRFKSTKVVVVESHTLLVTGTGDINGNKQIITLPLTLKEASEVRSNFLGSIKSQGKAIPLNLPKQVIDNLSGQVNFNLVFLSNQK